MGASIKFEKSNKAKSFPITKIFTVVPLTATHEDGKTAVSVCVKIAPEAQLLIKLINTLSSESDINIYEKLFTGYATLKSGDKNNKMQAYDVAQHKAMEKAFAYIYHCWELIHKKSVNIASIASAMCNYNLARTLQQTRYKIRAAYPQPK